MFVIHIHSLFLLLIFYFLHILICYPKEIEFLSSIYLFKIKYVNSTKQNTIEVILNDNGSKLKIDDM